MATKFLPIDRRQLNGHDKAMAFALFCGQSSYPRADSATANRYRALGEMTANLGYEVVFVNRHPVFRANEHVLSQPQFKAINVSGERSERNWIKRQLVRLISVPREAWKTVKLARSGPISVINVYSQFAFDLVFYYLLAKYLRAECVLHVVEYRSRIAHRSATLRVNDLIFEALAPRLFRRFIVISTLIERSIIARKPDAKVSIVPPVCRFEAISAIPKIESQRPYFLYCASLAYEDVAWFVIEAFLQLDAPDVDLVLVLSGKLSERIRAACERHESIKVLSKLDYEVLVGMYKGAHALLIPLRNIIQDSARYPQKITEYLAAGRPIISCKIGEVGRHFTNGVNAFLSENYDVSEYSEVMKLSLYDAGKVELIAQEGLRLGAELFDTRAQEHKLGLLLA